VVKMCACDVERGEVRKRNGGQEVEDEGEEDEDDAGDAEDAGHDDEKRSRTIFALFIDDSHAIIISVTCHLDLRHEHTYSPQRRKLRTQRRSQ